MASAAEHMASNISLANFAKATDLKKRLWFTLGALIVFRLLSFVPLPGIDPRALGSLFETTRGGVLDFFNMFSGGSLERMSLIALGVMPYITASIVVQLATSMSPALGRAEEGRRERAQEDQPIYPLRHRLPVRDPGLFHRRRPRGLGRGSGGSAVIDPGMMFRITTVITLVGGTMFLMWLGEQITGRGIGNGVSLIIMAGIVAQLPTSIAQAFEGGRTGTMSPLVILAIVAMVAVLILFICFMERAQRRVLIQYPKRQTARGQMQAERSHLPLKINTSGVIPPIFASSLLLMPLTIAQFAGNRIAGREHLGRHPDHRHHRPPARRAALHGAVRGRDHLLLLLLHGGGVQPGGDGGESEALRRLHPRHPARQAHRGISRLRPDPDHRHRRGLSDPDLPGARVRDRAHGHRLLSRRHRRCSSSST